MKAINQNMMKKNGNTAIIIPARYASTRFPGKPLALLAGKPIIQHVWQAALQVCRDVYVATDDERIAEKVREFGGNVVMTPSDLRSGTDRVACASEKIGGNYRVIINIQGDEPFIRREQIETLIHCFDREDTEIATIVKPMRIDTSIEKLENPNTPKVVMTKDGRALYFSRSIIPYVRGKEEKSWPSEHTYYKHIGIYGFRADILSQITALPQSSLEKAESLEQLRWLENGYTVRVGICDYDTVGIDTPQDLVRAEEFIRKTQKNVF